MKITAKRVKEIIREEMHMAYDEVQLNEGPLGDALKKSYADQVDKIEPLLQNVLTQLQDSLKEVAEGDIAKANEYKAMVMQVLEKMEIK